MTPDRSPSRARIAPSLATRPRAGRSRVVVATMLATLGVLAVALAGAVTVAGESPAPSDATASSGAPASMAPLPSGTTGIQIIQKTFQPANVTIQAGETVTWTVTQAIDASHSVTSGSYKDANPGSVFDSGIKLHADGDSFSYTFTQPGTYPYFCAVHPDTMSGVITVEAAGTGGGTAEAGIPVESKLVAAGVLTGALVILFGWAAAYRRMNPRP